MPTVLTAQYFYLYHPKHGFFTGFEHFHGRTEVKWHSEPNMPMQLALYPSEALAEEAVDMVVGTIPLLDQVEPPIIQMVALPMPA